MHRALPSESECRMRGSCQRRLRASLIAALSARLLSQQRAHAAAWMDIHDTCIHNCDSILARLHGPRSIHVSHDHPLHCELPLYLHIHHVGLEIMSTSHSFIA
ncbi:hypothetical protein IE81DRAFT_126406 [Ceraceosorus guamensis]|uniref:Uncharacterized protein n=1 Tax=Ceraceosorus guamensis TaxID=1522189 RepID=A0A316W9Q2_9BASI|nr:hypothetical protein IE81DRAFT_126406 [Ceraceosorus guamensis]PWN45788.1 hypothetical protein IE81DRAFT_126406 [Ceraceosorus guamensis]